MEKKFLILVTLFISFTSLFANVESGLLNLRDYNIENKIVDLSGEWVVIEDSGVSYTGNVPGWNGKKDRLTYKLTSISETPQNLVFVPTQTNSGYSFYLNDQLITEENGYRNRFIPVHLESGNNIFKMVITNRTDPVGGIRGKPYIGTPDQVAKIRNNMVRRDSFFTGLTFIIATFFLIFFINDRKALFALFFSLMCYALATRSLTVNNKIIFYFIPFIPGSLVQRVEYLCVYLIPPFFLMFFRHYFKYEKHRNIIRGVIAVSLLFPAAALVLPPIAYKSILFPYFLYAGVSILFSVILLIYYIYLKLEESFKFFLMFLIMSFGAIYDIAVFFIRSADSHILTITQSFYILFMIYNTVRNSMISFQKQEELSKDNIAVNLYLQKFVPASFIKTIGLGSILTIKKGDGVEKRLTVLFCSIIDFDCRDNQDNPEDTIAILNKFYQIIAPIIESYGGFVDKFMDETLMALFPGKSIDAVNAAIEINRVVKNNDKECIKIRTGIHVGKQYIGIVGDDNRIDATVISSVVNTGSRIHDFTSNINKNLLISEDVYRNITKEEHKFIDTIFMGRVKLKGNRNFIGIYAVNLEPPSEADVLFSKVMREMDSTSSKYIENELWHIHATHQEHVATKFYLDLINRTNSLEVKDKW